MISQNQISLNTLNFNNNSHDNNNIENKISNKSLSNSTHTKCSSSNNSKNIKIYNNKNISNKNKKCLGNIKNINSIPNFEAGRLIATIIEDIVEENKSYTEEELNMENNSIYYCETIPNISVKKYFERLISYSDIDTSTVILIGIYLDRFCYKAQFLLTKNTVFR